ncbi:FxsA family protein [Mesorhizobium sp. KR9-304]|uniref:FxsA family protein n=1 Tax=Mesorhizobium sp. KR9-304 TaxID=3156614 RepID=UPI0032B45334
MRLPVIALFLVALPFLEIASFVAVGRQIGVFATLALVIAAGVLGAILLRVQGFGVMARVSKELDAGQDPSRELANGAMILVAGILLLIPGFVTDIIGLLLFLPPVRALAWRFLKSRVIISAAGFGGFARPGARGKTIDLDADEYSTRPESGPRPESPWRRIDHD